MVNKFKVGDVVRTVKGMELPRLYTITNGNMLKGEVIGYWGDEIKIKVLNHKEKAWIGRTYLVKPNYFELVKPETIVIYRKDDKVYALDKATGKKVCAKCHPEDEFDFNKGAEIAFNRLLGKEPEKPKEEFYNGKVICVNTQGWNNLYTKGKIYQFEDGVFTYDDGSKLYGKYHSFKDFDSHSMADWLEVVE